MHTKSVSTTIAYSRCDPTYIRGAAGVIPGSDLLHDNSQAYIGWPRHAASESRSRIYRPIDCLIVYGRLKRIRSSVLAGDDSRATKYLYTIAKLLIVGIAIIQLG